MSEAERLTHSLAGRWFGDFGSALCPAHDNTDTPALSIFYNNVGELRVKCHAGCDYRDVIRSSPPGFFNARRQQGVASGGRYRSHEVRPDDVHARRREQFARKLWDDAVDLQTTVGERYLRSRGIALPAPKSLRFLNRCWHQPDRCNYPAIVAMAAEPGPFAIQRVFLAKDGSGKAPTANPRMMLGPMTGRVVVLREGDGPLMIGEGIETCLSAMHGNNFACWAALSSGNLGAIDLQGEPREIILLQDNDEAGRNAVLKSARRLTAAGHGVVIAHSPIGNDFNDLLQSLDGEAVRQVWITRRYSIRADWASAQLSNSEFRTEGLKA